MSMPYFGQNFPQPINNGGGFANKLFGGIADTNRMLLGHSLMKDLITHRENEGADAQMRVDKNREVTKAAANQWLTKKNYAANRSHLRSVNKMTNAGRVYPSDHPQAGQPVNGSDWSGVIQSANEKGTSFQKTPTWGFPGGGDTEKDTSGDGNNNNNNNDDDQPKLF